MLVFLKDGMVYEYERTRSADNFEIFMRGGYEEANKKYPIPQRVSTQGLHWEYVKKDTNKFL